MEVYEIRELSSEDINKKIIESKQKLFDLRLKQASGNLPNTSEIKKLRKVVAKMKTILRERELEIGGEKNERS